MTPTGDPAPVGHRWCRTCYERSIRRDIKIFIDYVSFNE